RGNPMQFVNQPAAWRRGLAVLTALAFVGAACGGDDDDATSPTQAPAETDATPGDTTSDGPSDTAGETPTGEPIKLLTVTTLNANGPTYENIAITAELAAGFINDNGGINGRPVEVELCDEQFDAAVAASCARQAVEDGVVSVVGSFT